jgi:UDP-2,4-diacetamido-2,4,6-trideoxy-beta-L-altropyranose hydrolase
MKFVIRVDAAPALGSGHAVRCLTLADGLAAQGHACAFAVRRMPQPLHGQMLAHGHGVIVLPDGDDWTAPLGAEWDAKRQAADAAATIAACGGTDWVICDHYGLGIAWEGAVRAAGPRVMALDDLGRVHDSDVLLDQNFYADPAARYAPDCARILLLGPRYALLRPEFAAARVHVAPRHGDIGRMLLFMSGTDAGDATSVALDAVEKAGLAHLPMDVVIGAAHPAREAIMARCAANPAWTLHVQTMRMAELLAAADLAIGAGGSGTWERCALGVPTLAVELADNQREVLREGAEAGLLYTAGGAPRAESLALHLRALVGNPGLRHLLSRTGLALVDANGVQRVISALSSGAIAIRRAEQRDVEAMYAWRNAPAVRAVSRDSVPLTRAAHDAWCAQTLADANRWLLIGERHGSAVGVVRFDRIGADEAEVSIYLAQGAPRGSGGPLLAAAESWLRVSVPGIGYITALVRAGNAVSEKLFARSGYQQVAASYRKRVAP